MQDLENIDYYCPDCKGKSDCKLSTSQTYKSKIKYVVIIITSVSHTCMGIQHLTLFFESYDLMFFFWDRSVENNQKPVLPENLAVVCNDMKGIYFPKLHL